MSERLDDAPCAYVEFDDDGVIRHVNQTLAEWLGFSADELVGRKFDDILTLPNRIFHQTHFFPLLKLQGRADEIFLNLQARDKSAIAVVTSATRSIKGAAAMNRCAFLTVRQRRQYEDEIVRARRDAEEALNNNSLLKAAKEEADRHLADLDRRVKQVELMNEELLHVSRIMSHDLREPMRKVRLFADLVRQNMSAGLDPESDGALKKISSESDRAIALVGSIQRFLNVPTDAPFGPTDLNQLVEEASRTAHTSFADWVMEKDHLPSIDAQPPALRLLFEQLFDNAIKFRALERPLRVTIAHRIVQQNSYRATQDRYAYRDYVQIEIADNGRGFDPKYRGYIFRLLKKVELDSPGFGIGLALCRKVAELHSGTLEVDPVPGRGTLFILRLPLVHEDGRNASPRRP